MTDCTFLADDLADGEDKWRQWAPIIRTFLDHGATVTKEVYGKVIRRANGGWLDHDKMYQVLVSLKSGDENSAMKHLRQAFFVYYLESMR